jgi:molecular chaperone DnaJ
MSSKRDYYEILGVSKGATGDEIKKAYRKKAKKYHPDVNPNDKESEKLFKEVNEAYEVLGDDRKRAQYDQFGHAAFDQSGGFGGGFSDFDFGGIGDIFESFFGGGFGGSSSRGNRPQKGRDLSYRVQVSFEEAAFGVQKDISVTRMENCSVCHGTGAKLGSERKTCPVCNGKGEIRYSQRTPLGQFVNVKTCDKCNGEGTIVDDPCPKCNGKGKEKKTMTISVDIPAGIDDGQTISLRGEGEPGSKGGPAGDLYISVSIKMHPLFKRDGYDVICEIPITFCDAALGSELEVPTLDGKVSYKIHEGTQTGSIFRLKNKGIPHIRGYGRGDQYVKVFVEVPKNLSDKQKELLKKFSELENEDTHEKKKGFFEKMKSAFGV